MYPSITDQEAAPSGGAGGEENEKYASSTGDSGIPDTSVEIESQTGKDEFQYFRNKCQLEQCNNIFTYGHTYVHRNYLTKVHLLLLLCSTPPLMILERSPTSMYPAKESPR